MDDANQGAGSAPSNVTPPVTGAAVPSNRELAEEAKALSDQLGVDVNTSGLNKAKLLELVEGLRSQLATRASGSDGSDSGASSSSDDASTSGAGADAGSAASSTSSMTTAASTLNASNVTPPVTGAAVPTAPATATPSADPTPAFGYYVADRHSITSLRGIIDAGKPVFARDLSGGEERLERLAAGGVLVKRRIKQ